MVIAKKVLYLLAGILKCAIGGLVFLIAALLVLLRGLFETILRTDPSVVEDMVGGLIESSESYAYLSTYSQEQCIDFVLDTAGRFGIVFVLISLIWIAIAVFNFILCKKISKSDTKKKFTLILTVVSWVASPLFISTILTTVGACLRKRKHSEDKIVIESYQE